MSNQQTVTERWSSPAAFVLAASAVVIGLGNVMRMPYLLTEYGGSAFLLVYLLALAMMGLPLFVGELILGRGQRSDLVSMLTNWATQAGLSRLWGWCGYAALIGAAMVLSYYSVIAGWSLAYVPRAASGALSALGDAGMREQFLALVSDPEKGLGWHTMFMVAATICTSYGLRRGIEPITRRLLVVMVLALLALVFLAATLEGATQALTVLFVPDFSELGWQGVIKALHQAFFTLTLGTGVFMAFGAYLRNKVELWQVGLAVVVLDTLFALAGAFVVIAILGTADVALTDGLLLIFQSMPTALMQVTGHWFTTLFFLLVLLVALTSALGLMEPVIVWLQSRFGLTRHYAATTAGLLIWFIGLGTLLSFNIWSDITLLGRTFFEWLSLLSTRIVLPLFGALICVLIGRFLPPYLIAREWRHSLGAIFIAWRWLLRYPARIGLILVVLYAVGVFAFIKDFW